MTAPVPDYIATILRTIDEAQRDPAQLRRLVYDLGRIAVGKQVLATYREIGSAGLEEVISDFETAVRRVEMLSQLEDQVHRRVTDVPSIEGPRARDVSPPGRQRNSTALVARQTFPQVYRSGTPEILEPTEIWEPVYAASPKESPNRVRKLELAIAVLAGLAMYGVFLGPADFFRAMLTPPPQQVAQSAPVSTPPPEPVRQMPPTPALGFPLPSTYGVYAVSEGKVYDLDPLAMRVPDPRVAISAMISNPSPVTLPSGKLSLLIYKRDLVSSAPDAVFVRVVARVMRELQFASAGPAKIVNINGEWTIRNKSYKLGVAPVPGNPEMVMLHADDPQFAFSPGRYVLVLKGEGYDFSVDGRITDTAQCLERTNALGGTVYSECRNIP
jgi:hypothetical protein